ncbi:hypothetical protein [Lentzea sp. E54]|uniref:hypothetical protein n=1 Tax=Lentzea xerophila TaxID=3435883 RepID=UPI003DA2617E
MPIADEWLLSGACRPFPASMRHDVYQAVLSTFATNKAAVFRNKEKLELAWKPQRDDGECFVAFFGNDQSAGIPSWHRR